MEVQKGIRYHPNYLEEHDWLLSEKLDGWRVRWTGKEMVLPRSEQVLPYPHPMPELVMDGELWAGHGNFLHLAQLRSVNPCFDKVTFHAFDLVRKDMKFLERYAVLQKTWIEWIMDGKDPQWNVINQIPLSSITLGKTPEENIALVLENTLSHKGEGLMLHWAEAEYKAGRYGHVLKVKPRTDEEVTVISHCAGGGRHEGRLGALHVKDDGGGTFNVGTGFTDAEREDPPLVGSRVTIGFFGRYPGGTPRHPVYMRPRPAGV